MTRRQDVDATLARIDDALAEPAGPDRRRPQLVDDQADAGQQPTPRSAGSFTGGCPCLWHVLWRTLTCHGQWAALAPLRHRTRRR